MLRGVFIGAALFALALVALNGDSRALVRGWAQLTASSSVVAHAGLRATAANLQRAADGPNVDDAQAQAAEAGAVQPASFRLSGVEPLDPGTFPAELAADQEGEIDGLPGDDPYVRAFEGGGPPSGQDDGSASDAESSEAEPATVELPSGDSDGAGENLLASTARETWVLSEPSWRARKLGYLRAGAVVPRGPKPVGDRGCSGGWYSVKPRGYVCVGSAATLEPSHPAVELSRRRPDMFGLPYDYAISRFPPPPLYVRLPTLAEQQQIEPELAYYQRKQARLSTQPEFVPPPAALAPSERMGEGVVLPGVAGSPRGSERITAGVARVRSGFALLGVFERDQRAFGLTTELTFVPLDRTRIVRPSGFRGVRLSDEFTLPVAFVTSKRANRYAPQGPDGPLRAAGAIGWREAVALTGESRVSGGALHYSTADGSWVRADQVVRIDPPKRLPGWARKGRRWVDVSILKQALVAYEGGTPAYVTLVSTGADGIGDPEKTHSTIQGTFLVHTKHVSVTMDGDEPGDQFDFNDVPFVQYFTEGYALHGTFWHDDFGTPRSHGCVNLSPVDAAWLFRWTTPDVPEGWHAALSAKRGTVVHVHP